MTSRSAGKHADEAPKGCQRPRVATVPSEWAASSGAEAIELAALAGVHLDPWQQYVLDQGLRERADGKWAAGEVAVNVPRQNGKGEIILARELAGLFLLGERLIVHTAHEFKTARVAFQRIEAVIMGRPDLRKRVKRVLNNTTETSITLRNGQSLQFLARSGGSGRGFTGDTIILDEDMILGEDAMGALGPTLAAVANPQLWYLGSAGIGRQSMQLGKLRRRALAAVEAGVPDPNLAYFEWSIDPHQDECLPGCTAHDDVDAPASVLKANPAVGYRLTLEWAANELLMMGPTVFARERLGVGDYPSDTADTWQVIGEEPWRALAAPESAPGEPLAFAIDMTPERSHAAICVAGPWRGGTHVEVVEHQPGSAWVIDKAAELHRKHKPRCWVVDGGGPANTLIPALEERLGITVVQPKVREIAQACGQLYDGVTEQTVSHIDQPPLAAALAGARKRPLGDAWAWARRGVDTDISPLMGVTLAKWGLNAEVEEPVNVMNSVW
jgi:hypothetical protein